MIRLYAYVVVLLAMYACGLKIEQLPVNESDEPEKVTVALLPEVSGATRSSIALDEYAIKDINVYAFRGGMLVSDNVLQDGDVCESRFAVTRRNRTIHSRMREYLYELKHHKLLETSIIPLGDGVALSTKVREE